MPYFGLSVHGFTSIHLQNYTIISRGRQVFVVALVPYNCVVTTSQQVGPEGNIIGDMS